MVYTNSDSLEPKYVYNMTLRLFGSEDPPEAWERDSKYERKACFKAGEEVKLQLLNMPAKYPELSPNVFLLVYFMLNLLVIYSMINEYHKLISKED